VKLIFKFAPRSTASRAAVRAVFVSARAFSSRKKRLTKRELREPAGASAEEFFIARRKTVELVKDLREAFKGSTITVQSFRETQENLNTQFERTENYLS
jgi:hypothetical protein